MFDIFKKLFKKDTTKAIACAKCAGKAKRIGQDEYTRYRCTKCGEKVGIKWKKPPEKPQWPISEKEKERILKQAKEMEEALQSREYCGVKEPFAKKPKDNPS